ncbi:MAG: Crp/Fnr family transcriptional regulator [Methylococcaceae bacterium]|nr:Crp/Fnr family transcriptional regulator [Methylococcaceae bacterium]
MDTIDILKNNELFNELTHDELQTLAELTLKRTVPKNTLVIGLGDTSNSLYLIKSGKVNVTVTNEEGKEMILSTLQPGDHFGELALLDEDPRSANIITVEKCEFIIIHRADFYAFLKQHASIAIGVIKYLCQRVRFITNIAQGLALLDVYGRLVKLLDGLAESGENGQRVITLPLTHKDIALRIGSSREMITRIISELEKGGYLAITNKIITLNRKLPSAW